MKVTLRAATLEDSKVLFANRNDVLTRKNSRHTDAVDFESHQRWLVNCLKDPNRRLFVLEVDGQAVGTSRLDSMQKKMEMSWSVFSQARGHGYGERLVAETLKRAKGRVYAEVKADNTASKKIAERVGFTLVSEKDGMLHYETLISN